MTEVLAVEPDAVEYPTSDGMPVAETDLHYLRLAGAAYGLRKFLAGRDDVYVGSNLLVYDEPGNPRSHLSPDIFVAFDVESGPRDLFKIWEEKPPSFVLEITSASTRREDERSKRRRYARWGVTEYFLYDPRGEWLEPTLQGLELGGNRYRRMAECKAPNGEHGFYSRVLNLYPWLDGTVLRLYDPTTGQNLPTPEEEGVGREAEAAARRAVEVRLNAAENRAHAAENRAKAESTSRERVEAARVRDQQTLLARQATVKFGAETGAALAALIDPVSRGDDFAQLGEWLIAADNPVELLARVRRLVS